ncbi:MAG: ABC transporter permease [Candidatus Marinimicrobia bacterium]|nr:ABC transporter permease [Candidatus Neomarinimicrobiota bacterium]MCF7828699.1 ABC transporter permease [Candidatus Neomarinimicrobiota bacterium]MCF7880440.1 ABC transporter permease [Candidatus Neomarinimicrobiota bacterium]
MQIGVRSLPLVTVVSIFAGAVSAWQAAYQLAGLMPLDFLGSAAGKAVLLEMGPVLTGLVIAGRNGASIAAEIGTMRVSEQVDALESMAIDPVRYLAMPRVLAATIMLPIVIVFADAIAMGGAFAVANLVYNQGANVFFGAFRQYFVVVDIVVSLVKGLVFGFTTSLIGVHVGLATFGGAKGVGNAAIRSFVYSSAVILINDFLIAMIIL